MLKKRKEKKTQKSSESTVRNPKLEGQNQNEAFESSTSGVKG